MIIAHATGLLEHVVNLRDYDPEPSPNDDGSIIIKREKCANYFAPVLLLDACSTVTNVLS